MQTDIQPEDQTPEDPTDLPRELGRFIHALYNKYGYEQSLGILTLPAEPSLYALQVTVGDSTAVVYWFDGECFEFPDPDGNIRRRYESYRDAVDYYCKLVICLRRPSQPGLTPEMFLQPSSLTE